MNIYQKYCIHSEIDWKYFDGNDRHCAALHCTALAYDFVGKYPLEPIWNFMRLTMTLSKQLIEQLIWLENLSRKGLRKSVINLPDLLMAIEMPFDAMQIVRMQPYINIYLINCSCSSYFYSLCLQCQFNFSLKIPATSWHSAVQCTVFI